MAFNLLVGQDAANLDLLTAESKVGIRLSASLTTNSMIDAFLEAGLLSGTGKLGCVSVFTATEQETYFQAEAARLYPDLTVELLTPIEASEPSKFKFEGTDYLEYFNVPLYQLLNYTRAVFPTDKTECTVMLLIDSTVFQAQKFYDAANESTLPVLFTGSTLRSEILSLMKRLTGTGLSPRLAIVADNSYMSFEFGTKLFLNSEPYFTPEDLTGTDVYSCNVAFMLNFSRVDFLACNSLTYAPWVAYYALLTGQGVIVGASNDQTGNISSGGDWVMESTGQDIQTFYFSPAISAYQSTLVAATIKDAHRHGQRGCAFRRPA